MIFKGLQLLDSEPSNSHFAQRRAPNDREAFPRFAQGPSGGGRLTAMVAGGVRRAWKNPWRVTGSRRIAFRARLPRSRVAKLLPLLAVPPALSIPIASQLRLIALGSPRSGTSQSRWYRHVARCLPRRIRPVRLSGTMSARDASIAEVHRPDPGVPGAACSQAWPCEGGGRKAAQASLTEPTKCTGSVMRDVTPLGADPPRHARRTFVNSGMPPFRIPVRFFR